MAPTERKEPARARRPRRRNRQRARRSLPLRDRRGVLRGIEGFGAHSRIHTSRILRLSEDLPVVIEIVDRAERVEAVLPVLDEMIGEGLITLEQVQVQVIAYRGPDVG